jgi:hypothetical protein
MKFLSIVCSIILGGIFIFSAIVKLFPVELFEYTFVEIGLSNWKFSPIIARLFIGFEWFLGSLLLFNVWGRKKEVALLGILLLLFFISYLAHQIYTVGNTGNCGCFGSFIKMTPSESIVKNVIMILLFIPIFITDFKGLWFKKIVLLSSFLFLFSFSMPFILNPLGYAQFPESTLKGDALFLDEVYKLTKKNKPSIELRKGKHLIAFMSATCPHCRLAGYKLHIFKKNNPSLAMYIFLNGDSVDIKDFFEETKATNIPYSLMEMKEGFVQNAGNSLPSIYMVKDNIIEQRKKYVTMEQTEIENWFNKK